MSMNWNIFGRVRCEIISEDGHYTATFVAADPVPKDNKNFVKRLGVSEN